MHYSLMRILIAVSIICSYLMGTAQIALKHNPGNLSSKLPYSAVKIEGVVLTDKAEMASWIENNIPAWTDCSFDLVHESYSRTGRHVTYVQTLHGIEIEGTALRLHINQANELFLVQKTLCPEFEVLSPLTFDTQLETLIWLATDNGFLLCKKMVNANGDIEYWNQGRKIFENSGKLFFQGPDTMVHAMVFMLNPLNTAGLEYGSPYVDNDDKDSDALSSERVWVKVPAYFEGDSFTLRTNRYIIAETSDPKYGITSSYADSMVFNRSQHQFEDVNAFYHINAFSDFIESIGFDYLLPDSLEIDAHAFGGADRSAFTFTSKPLRVEFGDGGVDDAEDGEVVVHEFGHSISHTAVPRTVIGSEREAMEEGNADYLMKTYSLEHMSGDINTDKVFSWDGHNEYWPGIKTGVLLRYPEHLTGNTNNDRAIWSTPLLCMRDKLGKEIADFLVLEHLNYQTKNSNMTSMAEIMLLIDEAEFGGTHISEISNCFAVNRILEGINPPPSDVSNLILFNSLKFALGQENMEILVPGDQIKTVIIFNEIGQIQLKSEGYFSKILLKHQDYSKGTYFIYAETPKYTEFRRFVKVD